MTDQPIVEQVFQVNLPNGNIDFIHVYDLPIKVAEKFVKNKYQSEEVEFIETIIPTKTTQIKP